MSWRMRIVHTTGYNYETPVTRSYNEARLSPRSEPRQNVILNRVESVPATRSYRYTDYWGTQVTAFDLHAPHTELEVAGLSVVETDPSVRPDERVTWSDLATDRILDWFNESLLNTNYVPKNAELISIARGLKKGLRPDEAVEAISQWVHSEMSYVPGTTGVHTSAVEAWEERKGVCQDYAHLTLLMLRGIGVPCRYVSGYLYPRSDSNIGETVSGESHAWIEAWTGGWWGYDPTNATDVSEQHVAVGAGRDYKDVPPLRGIYIGGKSKALDVVVDITRLA
ncbi:transglutaminase family protein [Hoyosella rhizosphaerae]|uniref:Transglutaminase-like protein n=1 Tax=Hoyosella rhizosphaerae TaxID=1755582 RepID=A0A916UGK7_9ACTN|nr:transglutaminase family protein [Hoyosella rhizosphaerae]MBN4928063.1 transglutaminase family protein [Hoyosella rhizosphaerae]GGC72108.1 transglutaminase-like protein [Hoyosella rhizosphaerae]